VAMLSSGMAIDVADQKRAEKSRLESERRFRHRADHAPVMIWMEPAVLQKLLAEHEPSVG